jgi:hypothetical protein
METDDGLLNGYSMTFEILDRFTNEIIHAQTITSGQGEYVDFGCHEIVGNQFNLRYTLNSPWVCGSKIISTIINEFGISINQCDPNTGIAPLYFGARWYCIGLGGGRGPEGPDLNPRP